MKELIKEAKRFQELAGIINENKYLINTIYTVPVDRFNSTLDVLKELILRLKFDKIIISGEIKNVEKNEDNFIANITFISLLNKPDLLKELKYRSTRMETWEIM